MRKLNLTQIVLKLNKMGQVVNQNVKTSGGVHARGIVKTFKAKLKNGDFSPKLKPATVKSKQSKGMPKPTTPLYGWGETVRNSMFNGLDVKFIGPAKWEVRPVGKHAGKISMQKLFAIHEFGANLKNGGKIPARKPIKRSVESYRQSTEYLKENHKVLKKIIGQVLK